MAGLSRRMNYGNALGELDLDQNVFVVKGKQQHTTEESHHFAEASHNARNVDQAPCEDKK